MTSSKESEYWIGFDLGGTKMLGAVYDVDFKCLGRKRRKTKGHEGADVGVDRIVQTIRQALEEANGVVAHAAKKLKMRRTTLVEKLRKYGLQRGQEMTGL